MSRLIYEFPSHLQSGVSKSGAQSGGVRFEGREDTGEVRKMAHKILVLPALFAEALERGRLKDGDGLTGGAG